MTPEDIHQHARAFREAMERCDFSDLPIGLEGFPAGSCGNAALLLGTHLTALGAGSFDDVMGERKEGDSWTSHAWLEGEGLVIDITADQFSEVDKAVIVTDDSLWHRTFEVESRQGSDFRRYDPRTSALLGVAYQRILDKLPGHPHPL